MFGDVSVRKRLEHGEIQFGVFLNMASPIATELGGGPATTCSCSTTSTAPRMS